MTESVLRMASAALREAIRETVQSSGIELTGRIWREIDERIEMDGTAMVLVGTLVDYARHVEYGVPAEKIPYTPGARTGATRSLYIEALIRYAELRGMDDPKRAAFAIATKHSKVGMPIDKQKLGFLDKSIKKATPQIERIIFDGLGVVVNNAVTQMIEKTQMAWDSV
jgi:hypothetical protein